MIHDVVIIGYGPTGMLAAILLGRAGHQVVVLERHNTLYNLVLRILARANVSNGRAKVQEVCVACHGEDGLSPSADFPHLAGQSGAAIYKQLYDYRTGSRAHPLMTEIAKALDESIIADVAAYYAGQPQRNPNPVTHAESPPAIVRLVELGDPRRNIPPCAACHRAGAGGPIEAPVLAEQREEYLVQQLKL